MADDPDPLPLTLARTIHNLLRDSGATEREQVATIQIVETLIRYVPSPDPRATTSTSAAS